MYRLNLDPEVIRYTGDPPFESIAAAEQFIRDYSQYRLYGFGRWAVHERETDTFIGWCGLRYSPEKNEVDLGYRFFRQYWGQGYATEAGKACLDYAFRALHLDFVVGNVMIENTASVKVLEKLGMSRWKTSTCGEQPSYVYRIEKGDFLNEKSAIKE
jgi:RimJ/RimL family protein N-acetyltransferase